VKRWQLWALVILVAWLLMDPRGLGGTVTQFFHSLSTFRNSFAGH
jgi:hypothetical protein